MRVEDISFSFFYRSIYAFVHTAVFLILQLPMSIQNIHLRATKDNIDIEIDVAYKWDVILTLTVTDILRTSTPLQNFLQIGQ